MPQLTHNSKALAYSDPQGGNQPLRRFFDWSRPLNITVDRPETLPRDLIAGETWTAFDETRATTVGADTAFSISQNATDPSRYRFTFAGGTNPTLRQDRGLALVGQALTVIVNQDQTVFFNLGGGTWGTVAVGDTVFVPGVSTGDAAGPLNILNEGWWVVLAVISPTSLQLGRPAGDIFQAVAETQTLAANANVRAWAAAGVQVGDTVSITAGFAATTQKTFAVDRLTSTWFEVVSSSAIPLETNKTPGAAGIVFYVQAKRFLRIETTQEIAVRINGASVDSLRISPVQAGDEAQTGWLDLWGPCWSLVIVNKSSQIASVTCFSAE